MNIVVLERNSVGQDIDVSCFEKLGEVIFYDNTVTEEDICSRIKDADIVVANKARLNRNTMERAENLKMICEMATGYDNIDVEYCRERGIRVANVTDYSTPIVAQHTITLALSILQKIVHYDQYVKSGEYGNQKLFSNYDVPFYELAGKTWGIAGFGNIGRQVAQIAEAFGCHVIYYSFTGRNSSDKYERVDKETLLRESDIVSLHCPLSELSRYFIDAQALSIMKKTAVLINVARGPVVNQQALYDALVNDQIAGAGLDVLEQEPIVESNPLCLIQDSSKLIITPHLAWASVEARQRLVQKACENIKAFLGGEKKNVIC